MVVYKCRPVPFLAASCHVISDVSVFPRFRDGDLADVEERRTEGVPSTLGSKSLYYLTLLG